MKEFTPVASGDKRGHHILDSLVVFVQDKNDLIK